MFDMGFLELLLIGIIALIVLGPERLPKAARTVGLWVGKAKQGFDSIKTEIDRELKLKELQQQIAEQKAELKAGLDVKSEFETLKDELNNSANTIHHETTSVKKALKKGTTAGNHSDAIKNKTSSLNTTTKEHNNEQ